MNLSISVRINGKTQSEYNTSGMLFSAQHFISRLSRYMTLWPGSVISFGTDNATVPPLDHGDVVEVVQQDIGVLRNPVVRDPAAA
jgi:2-keto-4-pentenoate hydratase/2-oxohepta-3-ene-1,7-dioic acid hydratase in catechol pathway